MAVMRGHKPAVKWLLRHGVPINATTEVGHTALHQSTADNDIKDDAGMVQLLLNNGADVHKYISLCQTALEGAALNNKVQCAKALIAAGVDVNYADIKGTTSLHMAVNNQHAAVVQVLLEHGATAIMNSVIATQCPHGARCCDGVTALMLCKKAATVKVLLDAGADVHVTNKGGDTCLHTAAEHKFAAPLLCLMIKAGVNLHAVNHAGKTAAQLAHERGFSLIEQLIYRAAQQQEL
eukprot:4572-Heterococcus_DN1.PRE.3